MIAPTKYRQIHLIHNLWLILAFTVKFGGNFFNYAVSWWPELFLNEIIALTTVIRIGKSYLNPKQSMLLKAAEQLQLWLLIKLQ